MDEIKGGVLVANHAIQTASTTFGRAADVVSIPTLHESCSRVHARIAFDSMGVPWLRDLGSGNGTTVGGRRLPARSVGKEDMTGSKREGARGVMVFPGDSIRFGASTRIYCLNGPSGFDRGAVKARMEAAKAKKHAIIDGPKEDSSENRPSDDVSWGIDMSDPVEHDENCAATAQLEIGSHGPILEEHVPQKCRKLYDRLRGWQYKLDNIMQESDRIDAKGANGELSEGQKTRLEQNRSKEKELRELVDEAEGDLREKIWGRGASGEARKRESAAQEEEDVDEFFDRTAKKSRHMEDNDGDVETEKSLTLTWKGLIAKLQRADSEDAKKRQRVNSLGAKVAAAEAAHDDEAFFLQNDLQLAKDQLLKNAIEKSTTEERLCEVEKLLRIVNPKLIYDRQSSFIGLESARRLPKEDPKEDPKEEKRDLSQMLPPMMRPVQKVQSPTMLPPPNRKSDDSPLMPPPPSRKVKECVSVSSLAVSMPPPMRKMRVIGASPPQGGTLAAIMSASRVPDGSNHASHDKLAKAPASIGTEPKEDKWRAPEDQDGSGVTKLNAKFAGRY